MADNPDLTEEQAAEKLEQIDADQPTDLFTDSGDDDDDDDEG